MVGGRSVPSTGSEGRSIRETEDRPEDHGEEEKVSCRASCFPFICSFSSQQPRAKARVEESERQRNEQPISPSTVEELSNLREERVVGGQVLLSSPIPPVSSHGEMEGSRSVRSTGSEGRSIRETEEEAEDYRVEEKVYVALGREQEEAKATLLWVLQNSSREETIVVTHVHRPAQMITLMRGKIPASQLEDQEVRAYRQLEREKMHEILDEYLVICSQEKVRAEKLVIEMDDIGKGLVELIARFGITNLVMGASASKQYSKTMKVPKSKIAITVKQQAGPSCKIWFVCKGHLICTREACPDSSGSEQSPMASPSFKTTQDLLRLGSKSDDLGSHGGGIMVALPPAGPFKTSVPRGRYITDGSPIDPSRSYQSPDYSTWSAGSNSSSLSTSSVEKSDKDLRFSSPYNEEYVEPDAEVYHKLQEALTEAGKLKCEAYQESRRRQKFERDSIEAIRKARAAESLYAREVRQRKETEETLARARLEMEVLKYRRDEIFVQLRKAKKQELAFELYIADSGNVVKDLEKKLSDAVYLLISLQAKHKESERQRDDAVREAEDLQHKKEQVMTSTHGAMNFSEFSYLELEQATRGFSDSLKIGEGSYGSVYKGFLRNTTVAIKILNPQSPQVRSEFHQEVDVLSRMRHPNLVTLIGACLEAWALVYEYFPRGSLEDRLSCKNNTPPLTWHVRTRIAAEICSALIFLHSDKPHPVFHGELKPDNILLDANFMSKLRDFGIHRLIVQSDTANPHPKHAFVYMDPEFIATGELTPHSDVYSLGVVLLRLLTGRPALGVVKEVQAAVDNGCLYGMIDASANKWPFVQARQLAQLGLRCCEINPKNRPDLGREVWPLLNRMSKAASLSLSSLSFGSISDDNNRIPIYFICPISQEIMRDPQIAADGFTYEAEVLEAWFSSGHDTSPMTNLKLPHYHLVPNNALHSAIQGWIHLQQS